jgi:hypothetical protein
LAASQADIDVAIVTLFVSRIACGLQAAFRLVQLNAFVRNPIADLLCPRMQEPPDPQIALTLRAA